MKLTKNAALGHLVGCSTSTDRTEAIFDRSEWHDCSIFFDGDR